MIAIASDHGGLRLKEEVKRVLVERKLEVIDLGTGSSESVDYPDFAHRLAAGIERREYAAGILVCGTGIGMGMAANRHQGVRAAVCACEYAARMARRHNDANVLCLGERITGIELAREIVLAFLGTSFDGGRHADRVMKIELPDA